MVRFLSGSGAGVRPAPIHLCRGWLMRCPQCGSETPDGEWNCGSCRMNVYWASRHYEDLARIRGGQGVPPAADTPSFLRQAHAHAMNERAERGGKDEHRVRQIARRAMRGKGDDPEKRDHAEDETGSGTGIALEPARNNAFLQSRREGRGAAATTRDRGTRDSGKTRRASTSRGPYAPAVPARLHSDG